MILKKNQTKKQDDDLIGRESKTKSHFNHFQLLLIFNKIEMINFEEVYCLHSYAMMIVVLL